LAFLLDPAIRRLAKIITTGEDAQALAAIKEVFARNESEIGLQESMWRFDAARGKRVAKEPKRSIRLLGHEQADERDKGTLH
jgi:hypothetical protein